MTDYRYVKGMNKSDRLGNVLSVDFSPSKVCSFDCIYCQVGRTTDKTVRRQAFYPVEEVLDEIRDWIDKNGFPDYALLTGSGEPTLYSELGNLVKHIKKSLSPMKTMVYSNGSLLGAKEVRQEVSAFDLVRFNLNSADEEIFRRICRPHSNVSCNNIITGMKQFRKEYTGWLWLDSIMVNRINTNDDILQRLVDTVAEIGPDRYIIRSLKPATGGEEESARVQIPQRLKEKWRDLPFEVEYMT